MERGRVDLTDYQKKIIRQKAIDKSMASREAREAMRDMPRCTCHNYPEPFCPNKNKDKEIPF